MIPVWHRFPTGVPPRLAILRPGCVHCPPWPGNVRQRKPSLPSRRRRRRAPGRRRCSTRAIIYCGDCLEQLKSLPDGCVDLIYIDPPFNSNRNYEVFWGETKEKRAFADHHASTQAYIDYMRPRCVEPSRVLKKSGSFYFHCDWHHRHGNGRRTLGTD